jgi:hypothetical protein
LFSICSVVDFIIGRRNYIMRHFIICTFHQMLLSPSNQGGWHRGTCSKPGGIEKCIQSVSQETWTEETSWETFGIHDRIILVDVRGWIILRDRWLLRGYAERWCCDMVMRVYGEGLCWMMMLIEYVDGWSSVTVLRCGAVEFCQGIMPSSYTERLWWGVVLWDFDDGLWVLLWEIMLWD